MNQTVTQAYSTKDWVPPFPATAHSTWVLTASWAFHQVSVKVCKAATRLSVNTFNNFYKVDVLSSADASFARKVLLLSRGSVTTLGVYCSGWVPV